MNDITPLHGLHHVTAVTATAQGNLDFYTRTLGMRLVKKTVNQDDVTAYHLFYADELGTAGSDLTFFDWAYATANRPGGGMAGETALRILGGTASLELWAAWLKKSDLAVSGIEPYAEWPSLAFTDAEGQRLRLVAEESSVAADRYHPWRGSPVGLSAAIVGLGGVTLSVRDVVGMAKFLTEVLGFRPRAETPDFFETGAGGVGALARLQEVKERGVHGAGGVHHVAWRVADVEELLTWQKRVEGFGIGTSGLVDRHYFRSLYFRIPEGILFELATDGPGFTADGEDLAHLGEHLALPPFLEARRAQIEAGVRPLKYQPAAI